MPWKASDKFDSVSMHKAKTLEDLQNTLEVLAIVQRIRVSPCDEHSVTDRPMGDMPSIVDQVSHG